MSRERIVATVTGRYHEFDQVPVERSARKDLRGSEHRHRA
jgi:hypothetical protein